MAGKTGIDEVHQTPRKKLVKNQPIQNDHITKEISVKPNTL